ncbi:MAG: glycoside hydrolase family 3 N-terminal domain-containing protein [Actinomycetota bacterium]
MEYEEAQAAVGGGEDPVAVAERFVAELTDEEKLWCLDGDSPTFAGLHHMLNEAGYHRLPAAAAVLDRVGFPGLHFVDGPRGCVVGNGTAFPVSMARGATWNPDLEERIGVAIGREIRAVGGNYTGAVCVNVLRHPAWGRAQETYGEDPFHVGELGAALTRGLQRYVLACVKHFACNSMENARFSVDIEVDDVALHEVYLPHFKRIVDEGVASVMTAYNSVNGEWCGQSPTLITDVLRGEWGFEGFTITDFVAGLRDAAESLAAGMDIEMPFRMVRATHLREALEGGTVTWQQVDAAAVRIVSTFLRFDGPLSAPTPSLQVLGMPEHRELAREAAAASVVLLRNEPVGHAPVLPIDANRSVAVIGRLADRINLGDGGSSDVWDLEATTVADGLRAVVDCTVDDGADPASAATLAAGADVAVVVVGYTANDEGEYIGSGSTDVITSLFPPGDDADEVARFHARAESGPPTTTPSHLAERPTGFSVGGDRSGLRLLDDDVALIRAVAAANPRTVVVIQAGSAVVVDEWLDAVPAVVQAWYGGCQAGPGLADVLLGDVAPSGRLPFSVPRDESHLPAFDRDATSFRYGRWHGWRHLKRQGHEPRFPFGFGLSYTSFEVESDGVELDGDEIVVSAGVTNTGDRQAAEVVQVYAELPDPEAPPRLVGFHRVEMAAGGRVSVEIRVPVERLSVRHPEQRTWRPAAGPHVITVARHVGDPAASAHTVEL